MNALRPIFAICFLVFVIAACSDPFEPPSALAPSLDMELDSDEADSDDDEEDDSDVLTIDHRVPHISTVAANGGELVHLFVRERVRSTDDRKKRRPVVLFVHGRSVPVLAVGELRYKRDYDWAGTLAKAGIDVFMLDFQGNGRSPRPKMDDPCNAPTAQQGLLIPNPLSAPCPHSYPFTLSTSTSDLNELDTVVEYIRTLRGVDKVHLLGWSAGSFRIGPYTVQHPGKVASLFFFAPIFNTAFIGPPPIADPTPMTLTTRASLFAGDGRTLGWDVEVRNAMASGCEDPREPGIQDVVWAAIMRDDDIGATWGPPPAGAPPGSPPEGLMRVRQAVNQLRVWNADVAARITVPTLIMRGEFDTGQGGLQHMAELYDLIGNPNKLRFTVQCAGHFMAWETQRRVVHHISKKWIKHMRVDGFEQGEFFVDTKGTLTPM